MDDTITEWVPPSTCDLCPHPIADHVLWEPDEICRGWMHFTAPDCNECWHDWPRLMPKEKTGLTSSN